MHRPLGLNAQERILKCSHLYRVIHNSLTHYKISVHLNEAKDGNMRYTDIKRNYPSLFCIPHKCSMCSPFVTLQTSSRPSISAHTRRSISRSILEIAAMIHLRTCHAGTVRTIALYCSLPAGPFQIWFENVAAPSRWTVFGHAQARKMSSLLASPFSFNQHPWRPPT
jgi:hypothetical protein